MSTAATPPRDISALIDADRVAVVGASTRANTPGNSIIEYLTRDFGGTVHPVHPTADTVAGHTAYRQVRAIDGPVDLAILLVRADRVPAALADCATAGVKTVIVGASGFADTGNTAAQRRLTAQARAAGIALLGPNCIGAANLHTGLAASFSPYFACPPDTPPGGLAVVSQSGGMGFGIASLAAQRGLGVGWIVTVGNEADISAAEVASMMASRPQCHGVIGFTEPGRSPWPRELPVPHAVLDAAGDHPDSATDVDDLLDSAAGFASPTPRGRRLAVIATSGGAAALARHSAGTAGFILPKWNDITAISLAARLPPYATVGNPLDITAMVATDPGLLRETLDTVRADPSHDAVLVCLCVLSGSQAEAAAEALIAAADERPLAVSRTGSRQLAPEFDAMLGAAGIGVYPTPVRAVTALASQKART